MAYSREAVMQAIQQAAARHGAPASVLNRKAEIESSYGRNLASPLSSAKGLFQFTDGTWNRVAKGQDVMDLNANADAAARHMGTVGNYMSKRLGRDLQDWEYYLGWQQGEGGATKLLQNPNARAVDVVGAKAVLNNGGTADMTAAQFANRWKDTYYGPKARIVTKQGETTQDQADQAAMAALGGGEGQSYIGQPSGGGERMAMAGQAPQAGQSPQVSVQDLMALYGGQAGGGGELYDLYLQRARLQKEERSEEEDSKPIWASLARSFAGDEDLGSQQYRAAVEEAIRQSRITRYGGSQA